jgi:hypothetical protein
MQLYSFFIEMLLINSCEQRKKKRITGQKNKMPSQKIDDQQNIKKTTCTSTVQENGKA